jgi:hypothetical protein
MSERAGELAIRSAMRATREDIIGLVHSEGVQVALVGVTLGALVAALSSLLLSKFFFQVSPLHQVAFLASPLVLIAAVLLATYFPGIEGKWCGTSEGAKSRVRSRVAPALRTGRSGWPTTEPSRSGLPCERGAGDGAGEHPRSYTRVPRLESGPAWD